MLPRAAARCPPAAAIQRPHGRGSASPRPRRRRTAAQVRLGLLRSAGAAVPAAVEGEHAAIAPGGRGSATSWREWMIDHVGMSDRGCRSRRTRRRSGRRSRSTCHLLVRIARRVCSWVVPVVRRSRHHSFPPALLDPRAVPPDQLDSDSRSKVSPSLKVTTSATSASSGISKAWRSPARRTLLAARPATRRRRVPPARAARTVRRGRLTFTRPSVLAVFVEVAHSLPPLVDEGQAGSAYIARCASRLDSVIRSRMPRCRFSMEPVVVGTSPWFPFAPVRGWVMIPRTRSNSRSGTGARLRRGTPPRGAGYRGEATGPPRRAWPAR